MIDSAHTRAAAISLALVFATGLPTLAGTPVKTKTGATLSPESMISNSESQAKYNPKALHRMDFRVIGKSCAVCLLGIQKRIYTLPGVVKVAVQLKPPYAATIIYDSSKTDKDKIMARAKQGLSDLVVAQLEDASIASVPMILIPKIGNDARTNN